MLSPPGQSELVRQAVMLDHIGYAVTDIDRSTAGGKDNGAPGIRPHYHANYYGTFVLDPDGNNIEAVCHAAA
jgi:hypothetical protein